jgi:hypothetical protein
MQHTAPVPARAAEGASAEPARDGGARSRQRAAGQQRPQGSTTRRAAAAASAGGRRAVRRLGRGVLRAAGREKATTGSSRLCSVRFSTTSKQPASNHGRQRQRRCVTSSPHAAACAAVERACAQRVAPRPSFHLPLARVRLHHSLYSRLACCAPAQAARMASIAATSWDTCSRHVRPRVGPVSRRRLAVSSVRRATPSLLPTPLGTCSILPAALHPFETSQCCVIHCAPTRSPRLDPFCRRFGPHVMSPLGHAVSTSRRARLCCSCLRQRVSRYAETAERRLAATRQPVACSTR